MIILCREKITRSSTVLTALRIPNIITVIVLPAGGLLQAIVTKVMLRTVPKMISVLFNQRLLFLQCLTHRKKVWKHCAISITRLAIKYGALMVLLMVSALSTIGMQKHILQLMKDRL